MYADWSSLTIQLQSLGSATQSVLSKLPQDDGKQVVAAVVKTVASHLGITVPSDAKPSTLNTEQEVNWCMEVICHGLCLPLTEHEVIRDSVNIYCEWLSALLPNPKVCVPKPVQEDPNFYAQKIITQLNHLFIPRKGEEEHLLNTIADKNAKGRNTAQDTIHRQAVVCHRVLRRVQELAHQSQIMERGTWDALLSFLLAINDALLSPPAVKDDIGDQLCERVLGVLFEIWLIACVKSFPGPTLWKTLREMCMNWRHRAGLVTQWNRVNLTLTSRLIAFLYGPRFPVLNIPKEDMDLVPTEMTHECVAQSWYRFLNCLGNPVELSKPVSVSDTQQFKEYALKSFGVIDPTYHPCLVSLPTIFLRAMKGVSAIVDAYLGVYNSLHLDQDIPEPEPVSALLNNPLIPTPPASRKNIILGLAAQAHSHMSSIPSRAQNRSLKDSIIKTPIMRERSDVGKSQSVIGRPTAKDSVVEKTALGRAISVDGNALPNLEGLPRAGQIMSMSRSSSATSAAVSTTSSTSMNVSTQSIVNSTAVLAAVTGTLSDQHNLTPSPLRPSCNSILHLFGLWLFEAAFIGTDAAKTGGSKKEQTGSSRPSSLSKGNTTMTSEPVDLPPGLTPDKFESGRAEALGALCRVLCSKRTGEEILPVYLARFYLAVQNGLTVGHDKVVSESLASILLNSSNLLRIDLDGVNVLAPSIVSALEAVLPEKEVKLTASYVNKADLRRAAIHLLQSMLTLPLHFANMQIKELLPIGERPAVNNFNQLKPRLVNLLINALQVEVEAVNTQMLLGCLLMTVQDAAALEEAELRQNDGFSDNSARNSAGVFQAASDSVSMMSDYTSISGDRHSLQEHMLDASYADNVTDSAHALFVRATYLVCHRLISSWKSDLATSLAALELLRGLARINIPEQGLILFESFNIYRRLCFCKITSMLMFFCQSWISLIFI
ncbi:ral GTPase-activating protein subunit beta isoform X1 [Eurytemora carolleeae]|uniref:ral GTPase-activating protein subunit beta isoform X1 n=1 Tax=Eurytemora carolleeae TaxID=1294199 RepID=UPI000C774AE3|nr:ral GTPase-activating protein subunit beta isoform X1 [Eurytemora carolleeae]|eukprot:XP_023326700.1 ral GTPase-activating protein subunit beta-like isoform X1 [Eurytemora affinis]